MLYNELVDPQSLSVAWDRTSPSAPAPKSDDGHLPDATKAGSESVYKLLHTQSKSWQDTSPLWSVGVDGPLQAQELFTREWQATHLIPILPTPASPSPLTSSRDRNGRFTSDTAIFNEIRPAGPAWITVGNLPSKHALTVQEPGQGRGGSTYPARPATR